MNRGYAWRTHLNETFADQFPHGAFHFAVGDGWLELLAEVFKRVDAALDDEDERSNFGWNDVKEKWGLLRMTHNGGDRIEAVVEWAEAASERICDHCGLAGRLWQTGTWRVRCDACVGF